MIFQNRLFRREFSAARLVAVATPAGVEAAHAAAPSTAAAEMAPCAAAAIAATTAVAASSPASSPASSHAIKLAIAGIATSHFPVCAAAHCAASVAADPLLPPS